MTAEAEAPAFDFLEDYAQFATDLPSYREALNSVGTDQQTVHEHFLEIEGHKWLTMKIWSRAPDPKYLPVFMEGQPITGEVILDLKKPESIVSVTVNISGCARFSGIDSRPFLSLSHTLWQTSTDYSGFQKMMGNTEKLIGTHTLPFSLTLPAHLSVDKDQWKNMNLSGEERLPPMMYSRSWSWGFNYELAIEVKRSGMLSIDEGLKTLFGYTPSIKAERPSAQRLQAYENEKATSLPGPTEDPQGWQIFPPVEIEGKIFDTRKVSVIYTLAMAAPASYMAGSILHFFLSVESTDEHALGLLSSPDAPDLTIRRKVRSVPGVGDAGGVLTLPGEEGDRPLAKTIWATSDSQWGGPQTKTLYGEMQLSKGWTPSFEFGDFGLRYCVDMYSPKVAGFIPTHMKRVFRTDIAICSVPYDGPRGRSYLTISGDAQRAGAEH